MMDDGLDNVRNLFRESIAGSRQKPATLSRIATGKPDMLRKFLDEGTTPRADRLMAMCKVLGLEFYIGPRRKGDASDQRPEFASGRSAERQPDPQPISLDDLTLAVELVERTLVRLNREMPPRRKAEAIAEFYSRIETGDMVEPATIERLMKIA